jgi:hypothetical protein
MPVDPGSHVIEAKAPNKKTWHETVQVGVNAAKVTVAIPSLEEDRASTASAPAAAPPSASGSSPPGASNVAAETSSGSGSRTIGFVLLGAGVAGLAVGTVFGLQARSNNETALGICKDNPNQCPDPERETHDAAVNDARSALTMSVVGFAAGGAAIVGGVIVLATSKSSKSGAASVQLAPVASPHAGGLTVLGRW